MPDTDEEIIIPLYRDDQIEIPSLDGIELFSDVDLKIPSLDDEVKTPSDDEVNSSSKIIYSNLSGIVKRTEKLRDSPTYLEFFVR